MPWLVAQARRGAGTGAEYNRGGMEAALTPRSSLTARSSTSELPSDKAARIVEAMRACVASSGFAGATFDNVARQAGVSRGLLHYYFSTKERLLAEVVRRECQVRLGCSIRRSPPRAVPTT